MPKTLANIIGGYQTLKNNHYEICSTGTAERGYLKFVNDYQYF